MYALIHNNKVISGPRDWDRAFWSMLLKQRGISFSLFPRKPVDVPHFLNEDTKICKVETVYEELTDMLQFHEGPYWDLSSDVAVATYKAVDLPLEFAQANFKELAAAERYKKEVASMTVSVQDTDIAISTARDDRDQYLKKAETMADGESVKWKFGSLWMDLSKSDLMSIASQVEAHVQDTFDWEFGIVSQIDAVTDAQQLLDIEIVEPSDKELLNDPANGEVIAAFREENPDATREELVAHLRAQ